MKQPFELNQGNLLKHLNETGMSPTLQRAHGQPYITLQVDTHEIPVFFGILSDGALLQTIAYLPFETQEGTVGEIGRLLHLLNKELDMPGFGMDEENKVIFYRCVLPCLDKKLNPALLDLYLKTTQFVCDTFLNAIALILSGNTTLEQVKAEQRKGT